MLPGDQVANPDTHDRNRDSKDGYRVSQRLSMPEAREPSIELVQVDGELSAHDLEVVLIHPCARDFRSRVRVAVIDRQGVNKRSGDQPEKQHNCAAVIGDQVTGPALFRGPALRRRATHSGQSWRDNASLITRMSCSAPKGLNSGITPASITPSTRLSRPVMRITGTVGYASRSVSAS